MLSLHTIMAGALERPWTACVGFLPLAEYVDARDADTILWLDIGTSLLSPDNTLYSQVETRYVPALTQDCRPDGGAYPRLLPDAGPG